MFAALTVSLLATAPQESETSLIVPHVLTGVPDEIDELVCRPVFQVLISGRVIFEREVLHDPLDSTHKPWQSVLEKLAMSSLRMERELLPGTEDGAQVPSEPILIHADLNAPFRPSLKIMEFAAQQRIRHIHFAVGDARKVDRKLGLQPSTTWEQRLELTLPIDLVPPVEKPGPGPLEVSIRVLEAGQRLEMRRDEDVLWKEESGTRFRLDLSTRKVEYSIGARQILGFSAFAQRLQGMRATLRNRPLVITVGEGATTAEAILVLDAGRGLGVGEVTFVAADSGEERK